MWKFELEVISPVHIGTGEKITDWEHVIESGKVKVYPYEYLIGQIAEKNPRFLGNLKALMLNSDFNLKKLLSEGLSIEKPLYELELRGKSQPKGIELFIKSLGEPYVPGSEIKGALRTAFIGGLLLKDSGLREHVKKILEERAQSKSALNKLGSKGGGFEELFLYPEGKSDIKYDLFKWLSVSDMPCRLEDLCVEMPRIVGSNRSAFACEALKEGTKLTGKLGIDNSSMEVARSSMRLNYRVFSILNVPHISWDLLQELSQSFYNLVIDFEIEFFKNKNLHNTVEHLKKIKERAKEGILLRIGKHQGYLSTTIMAVYKKTNPELFSRVYENSVSNVRPEKPKTRKISSEGLTFGWVLLKRL